MANFDFQSDPELVYQPLALMNTESNVQVRFSNVQNRLPGLESLLDESLCILGKAQSLEKMFETRHQSCRMKIRKDPEPSPRSNVWWWGRQDGWKLDFAQLIPCIKRDQFQTEVASFPRMASLAAWRDYRSSGCCRGYLDDWPLG